MSRVGIVGGGLLGQALASKLLAAGHQVTVIEAGDAPGGLARPARMGPYQWDRFYHVILMSDRHLLELLDTIGLRQELRWGQTRTGFYVDRKLYSLSSNLDFIRFPPLSILDKFRLALTILRASRIGDGRPLESIPVVEWLTRWSGSRVVERLWLPLLKSKLGQNYRIASAAFIWAIIARMYAARRSGLKREMFGYVDGGYATILDALERHLTKQGVVWRLGCPVERVTSDEHTVTVRTSDGSAMTFDHVVLTAPCPVVSRLCPQLREEERARLDGVVYQGITCASLLLKRPLADYYVTNITDPSIPFTGVIEMTALVDRARFGGNSLVYLPRYLAQDDDFWHLSDGDVETRFLDGLKRMYPDFRREDVVAFVVSRVRHVLAVSTLHYTRDALPPMKTSVPGVHLINSSQIAQGTLNVNETLALAESGGRALLAELEAGPRHPAVTGAPA